jgi:hypothetical protein
MFTVRDESTGRTKHTGRSVAKVIDNIDPKKEGRIRVFHPLIGESGWIDYLRLPGQFSVPEIEELVYIEADAGDLTFAVAWGNLTKEEDTSIPETFKRNRPSNRGMFTKEGHLLELDDGTGPTKSDNKGIRITSSGGKKLHFSEDSSKFESTITLEDDSGNGLKIDENSNSFTIATSTGAEFKLESEDITITNSTVSITISSSGDIEIVGPTSTLSMAAAGDLEFSNTVGSLVINATGQFEIKGPSAGLADILSQTLQTLSTTLAPGFNAPLSTVAQFAALQAQLDLNRVT